MTEATQTSLSEQLEFFLKGFTNGDARYKYRALIGAMKVHNAKSILVDFADIATYSAELGKKLFKEPDIVLEAFNLALYATLKLEHPDYAEEIKNVMRVRIGAFPNSFTIADVKRSDAIKRLCSVTGYVVSLSDIYVQYKAKYKCSNNHLTVTEEDDAKPDYCKKCSDGTLQLEHDSEEKKTIQYGYLIDNNLSDKNAYELKFILIDTLVNTVRHGELITLTGIPRLQKEKFNANTASILHVNNIDFLKNTALEFTEEEVREFYAFSLKPDAYETLVESVAPSIFGWDGVKEGILLQQVSNGKIRLPNNETIRTNLHVLLLGDPSVAKSQLLAWVANNISGSALRQANLSSALGLTAGIAKKPDGTVYMSVGAIALASGATCCIEEFDKTSRFDQEKLYYVMEQQRIPSQKTGASIDLVTDTNLLCDANPKNSYYDEYSSFVDQVNFERSLLTRFDLIFIMRDIVNEERDKSIAQRIHKNMSGILEGDTIDARFLSRYLQYAKTLHPELPKELEKTFSEYYTKARATSLNILESVRITPRQLESLYRLAFAHARLLLKKEVDLDDAEHAIIILTQRLNEVGYGMIVPKSREDRALEIAIEIVRLNAEKNLPTTIEVIYNESKLYCKTETEHTYMFGETSTTYENKKLRKIKDQLDKAANIRVLNDKARMWTYDKSQITFDRGEGKK